MYATKREIREGNSRRMNPFPHTIASMDNSHAQYNPVPTTQSDIITIVYHMQM